MNVVANHLAARRCLPVALLIAVCHLAQAQTAIRLEGDVWAPYVMDPASGREGFMVEIAELALARAGYTVSFAAVPWTRSLMNAERGANDGIVGIYFSQARERGFVLPSEELGISVNNFFVKKTSTWTFSGARSLKTMVLGTIADYDYGELNPYIEKMAAERSKALHIGTGNNALQKNLRMLLADRITVLIEDPVVVNFAAHEIGVDQQIKAAGAVEPRNPVGIAFSPKNPKAAEYASALSSGIQKLRESGELKAILDKYYVADWK